MIHIKYTNNYRHNSCLLYIINVFVNQSELLRLLPTLILTNLKHIFSRKCIQ